jgi:hypothetical protein
VKLTSVGSGTGAVIRRQLLGGSRGFPLRARAEATVSPSPVPATSHAACGFPALRARTPVRAEGYENVRNETAAARPVSRRRGTHISPDLAHERFIWVWRRCEHLYAPGCQIDHEDGVMMPAQQRVRCDDRGDLPKRTSGHRYARAAPARRSSRPARTRRSR